MVKIADAPGGQDTSVGGSEKLPCDDGGVGKYMTVDQIKQYVIDSVEAIAAGTVVDGNDKLYVLDATDSVMKPVDIDTVLQHIVDAVWAKTALTAATSADAILIKDGGVSGVEKTMTLGYLADYVKETIEAAILDISDLSDGAGALASADYILVTQSGVGKRIAVSDLNTFIHAGLKTYIDTLSAVGTAAGTDYFYCVQGTTQKTVTLDKIAAYIESKLPTVSTPNYIPQWDNATGTLKDGKELVTTINGSSTDDQIPTANSVKDFTDVLIYSQSDIGADLLSTDTILVDDGALGTQKKSTLARVWTYIWSNFTGAAAKTTPVSADIIPIQDSEDSNNIKEMTITNMMKALDIDGMDDIGAALVDADLMIVDDGAVGTNRKSAISRLWTYILGKAQSTVDLIFADMAPGAAGITAVATAFCKSSVQRVGSLYKTTTIIDLTGLTSGGTDGDIIGKSATADCQIGQITAALNGTIFAGKITCLEVPTGGTDDIDLHSSATGGGTQDAAPTAPTALLTSGGSWTLMEVMPLTTFPAANDYLYLVNGETVGPAAYTTGIFEIELWGKA